MPLPENNAESWQQLRVRIEEDSDDVRRAPWQELARQVLSELEKLGMGPLFRVGMSRSHVIFSTAEHHGLKNEPRVTLGFLPETQEVRIAYSKADIEVQAPLIEAWVSAAVAGQVTAGGLRRLWTETRPDVPMPEELLRG